MGLDCCIIQNIQTGMLLFSYNDAETLDPILISASFTALQRIFNLLSHFTYIAQIVMTDTTNYSTRSLNSIFYEDFALSFFTEGVPSQHVIHLAKQVLIAFIEKYKTKNEEYVDLRDYFDFAQDPSFATLNDATNLKVRPTTGKAIIPLAGLSSVGMTKLFGKYLPPWIFMVYKSKPKPTVSDKSYFEAQDKISIDEGILEQPANLLLSTAHILKVFGKLFGSYDVFTLFVPSKDQSYFLCVDPNEDFTLFKEQGSTPGFAVLFLVKKTQSSYVINPYRVFPKAIKELRTIKPRALLHNKQFLDNNIKNSLDEILREGVGVTSQKLSRPLSSTYRQTF
ncbi:MAG: hypothetical protein ACFFDI_29145 [Promethearchaeota archaeon]